MRDGMRRKVPPSEASVFEDFKRVQAFLEGQCPGNHALKDGVRAVRGADDDPIFWAAEGLRFDDFLRH